MIKEKTVVVINDRADLDTISKISIFIDAFNEVSVKEIENQAHCGFSFPDDIKENAKPKLYTSSIGYNIVVKK